MNTMVCMTLKNSLLILLLLGTQAQAETRYTYYHNDLFGSPVAMTDQAGNVVARKDYTPYGEASGNDGANHVGFTGHAEDQLTHLTYMQQRLQDPRTGRFLSIDPASVDPEDPMTFNRYAYANNNPYKFVDPDGRAAFLVFIPPALEVLGAAITGYETGTAASNISRGEQSVGEAVSDAAVGVSVGVATGGAGKVLGALAKEANVTWKNLAKQRQNNVNSFMTQHGKGADGANALLDDINKNGVPKGLDKDAFKAYQKQITNVGGNKQATSTSEVFQTRQKILNKIAKDK